VALFSSQNTRPLLRHLIVPRRRIRDEWQQQFFHDFNPHVLKISIHFTLLDIITMELRTLPIINPVRTSPARGAMQAATIPHPRIPHSIRALRCPEQI
jgi:hypothetical protein